MSWQHIAADILPYYDYTVGIISYILNCLVIYLAKTQMHKGTAEYKTILYLNCGVDLIFTTMCDVQDGIFFILSTGPLADVPQPYAAIIAFIWSWAFMLTVVTVPIQFLYRYSQICLKNQITTKQYVLIYGGFILAVAVHLVAGFHIYVTDPEALKEYEHLLRRNPMFRENMPVFNVAITTSLITQLHMLNTMLIVCVAYAVAVYCAVKTLKRLNESQDSFSEATRAAQRQFTIIMFVQQKMSWQDVVADLLPYYDYTVGITSYILNCLVIYLAKTQMNKGTAEYKTILYLNCGVDLIFNTFSTITRTICDVQDGIFFILSTGPVGKVPQPYAAIISFIWSWALFLTVVTVPIQFLYRYSQLCLKNQITTRTYVLIYGGFMLAVVVHLVVGFHVYVTDPAALKEYEPLMRRNPMFREHMPVFTVAITTSLITQLHMLHSMLIVCVAYSVVVYCAVKTLQRLKDTQDSLSKETLAAQRQLTVIMFIQAINPLIMLNMPICLSFTLTLLNVTVSGFSFIISPLPYVIPIVNPLCVIFVIPSFRSEGMTWQETAEEFMPYYSYTAAAISYVLNLLVIYLAKTQMNKNTAEYKTIIFLNCAVDFIFITCNVMTATVAEVQDGNLFLLSTSFLGDVPQPYAAMITFTWLWSLLLTVVTVPIQFLYRYSQLCLKEKITTKQYILIYGAFVMALAIHCAAGNFVFETNPEVLRKYEYLMRRNLLYQKRMPVFTLGFKDSPIQALHMLNCMLIVGTAYSIVVYCAIKTLRHLKETRKSLSRNTMAAQKQLTIIMFMQATNPLIMLNFPIFLTCIFTLFNVTVTGIAIFIAPVVAFIPILNPLCVIIVIPSFRKFVFCQRGGRDGKIGTNTDVYSIRNSTSDPH
uniref:Uncharacterized protein n=1 Tax=Bursaphelenchus xylophilus TaxID=6326 RepID=A0A1I7RWQ4_BURXY